MPRRFVDLSVSLQAGIRSDPDPMLPQIVCRSDRETAREVCSLFPGLAPEQLPEGMGWAVENVRISTHNGTHMDAPRRYRPTMDGGERAAASDEIPLEWRRRPGVRLDFRHFEDGYVVTPADIEQELERIGHALQPLNIVVANTAAAERYGHDDYLFKGCGFGREATLWLTARGVRVVVADA